MKSEYIKSEIEALVEGSDRYSTRTRQGKLLVAGVNRALELQEEKLDLQGRISSILYGSPRILDYRKFDENLYIVQTDQYWRTVNIENRQSLSQVSKSYEQQLLITLANKYDGLNSQFPYFASKMLGKDFVEKN